MNMRNVKTLLMAFIAITFTVSSCNTARLNQGFSYKPAVEGPAIGSQSNVETEKTDASQENNNFNTKSFEISKNIPETQLNQQEVGFTNIDLAKHEVEIESQKPVEIKKTFQDAVNQYALEHEKTFTKKQQKKLNKIAAIIESKASFSSINWAPETNVELFFLLGAGIGLLVGLLSIGLGWFIFIVFSLLYLFFKLIA
jgi:hypothetical protein